MIGVICLIIITLFLPPLGVLLIAGCGADFCINLCLTILGFFPGHIHAFYVEYVYYKRRDQARMGVYDSRPAPGIFSDRVNFGHRNQYVVAPDQQPAQPQPQPHAYPEPSYGTVAPPPAQPPVYSK
ncbi:uncharacterized protein PV09_02111 [Verruconis gallopava]|uniref:Plasma membrane proteolipid 3 n=1 Tax=Verruconis gallopava TaxID=253628 RepID=A0A0D1XWS8_9PEZI|nr:uncharacterized protein PV09_02111 [Verruconis gallopava]KIW07256.1 hypothetical protein PV09_02111 [Verruconis gallopava]